MKNRIIFFIHPAYLLKVLLSNSLYRSYGMNKMQTFKKKKFVI